MQTRRISKGNPECVYVSVRNAGLTTLGVGYLAMYAFHSTSYADGVNVCTYSSTVSIHLWQLAGVVSRYPIPPGCGGLLQVYGYHRSVYAKMPAAGATTWGAAGASVISPVTTTSGMGTIVAETSWISYGGGVIRLAATTNASESTSDTGYWPAFIRMM